MPRGKHAAGQRRRVGAASPVGDADSPGSEGAAATPAARPAPPTVTFTPVDTDDAGARHTLVIDTADGGGGGGGGTGGGNAGARAHPHRHPHRSAAGRVLRETKSSSALAAAVQSPGDDADVDSLRIVADDDGPLRGQGDASVMKGWAAWRNTYQRRAKDEPGYLPITPNTPPQDVPVVDYACVPFPTDHPDFAVTPMPLAMSPTSADIDPDFGFWSYLSKEVNWGKFRRRRNSFPATVPLSYFQVPLELEKFLLFGFLSCVDAFLHVFTFVPFRAIRGICLVCLNACRPVAGHVFHRAEVYDVLRGLIIFISSYVLSYLELSYVYHYIRGEAIIKLYVIFNILEILDKLLSSFGQDLMNSLYRTIRDHPRYLTTKLVVNVLLSVVYVVVHSVLLFVQLVSLNVAIDSRSNALLPLLVSNNFVELKSSVFKRFEPENLFQVACSDAVERFQLLVFMSLILVQDLSKLPELLETALYICACEVLVDSFKHFFISKFNRMAADNYNKFHAVLSHDLITSRLKMKYCLDPTHAVTRRLGFATIPLSCVVIRFVFARTHITSSALDTFAPMRLLILALFAACLFAVKVLVNLCVLGHAASVGDGGLSDFVPLGAPAAPTAPPPTLGKPPVSWAAGGPDAAASSINQPPTTQPVVDGVAVGAQFASRALGVAASDPQRSTPSPDPVVARVAKMTRYTLHRNRIPL